MQDYLPAEPIHITNFTYVLYSVSTNEDNAEQILCVIHHVKLNIYVSFYHIVKLGKMLFATHILLEVCTF